MGEQNRADAKRKGRKEENKEEQMWIEAEEETVRQGKRGFGANSQSAQERDCLNNITVPKFPINFPDRNVMRKRFTYFNNPPFYAAVYEKCMM